MNITPPGNIRFGQKENTYFLEPPKPPKDNRYKVTDLQAVRDKFDAKAAQRRATNSLTGEIDLLAIAAFREMARKKLMDEPAVTVAHVLVDLLKNGEQTVGEVIGSLPIDETELTASLDRFSDDYYGFLVKNGTSIESGDFKYGMTSWGRDFLRAAYGKVLELPAKGYVYTAPPTEDSTWWDQSS